MERFLQDLLPRTGRRRLEVRKKERDKETQGRDSEEKGKRDGKGKR